MPDTANGARNRLTNDADSLDTANDTTSTHQRENLLESQQKQQDTSSDQDCTQTAHNTYLENVGTDLRKQSLTLTLFLSKLITVPHAASPTTRNISSPSNRSTAATLQVYSDHQERNHLSKEKELSIGRLRMTMVSFTQSNSRIRYTYRHSPTVCYVHSIGVKYRTITSHNEMEHGKLPIPIQLCCTGINVDTRETVSWNPRTNTGFFRSAAGAIDYRVYSAAIDAVNEVETHEHVCYQSHIDDTHLVSDDEQENGSVFSNDTSNNNHNANAENNNETREENLTDYFTKESSKDQVNVIDDEDEPLAADTPQAELLRWHYRLGHLPFARLRILALLGTIPRRLLTVKSPKCAGCMYGAMTKRPWRTKGNQNKSKIRTATSPGDCVSVDQLESPTPGFLAQLKGGLTKRRYGAATVFVDHASRLGYVHLQGRITSDETVQAKQAFEAYARSHGVTVKHYHADNGRFADNAFLKSVAESGQTISFCGVNAHFQNGIAEKRIRDLSEQARKQLLHAKARWPSAIEINLWPYALRNANDIRNTIPDKDDGSSPLERFCRSEVRPKLRHNHTFGCPVYSLHDKLQGGKGLPKWNPRARLGINLGTSPRHASSVNLVLKLDTGLASPQFHVQCDDFFETVRPSAGNPRTFSQWQYISGLKTRRERDMMPASEGVSLPLEPEQTIPQSESQPDELNLQDESQPNELDSGDDTADAAGTNDLPDRSNDQQRDDTGTGATPSVSRYGRIRRPTQRMRESLEQRNVAFQAYYEAMHEDDYLLQDEMMNPIAFMANSNQDTMYFHQAMKAPDRDQFTKAIVKEVNDHIEHKHWELIPRDAVPKGVKVLPSVWSMKRKRDVKTQRVYKHKARLNVHGGKQVYGENYFETFAPVVTWFSIRLLLVLSILNNWHTRQVDFVLAYTQADIEFDMCMELPKGIETKHGNGKTHVLKLLKNLYGQKQAGRVWNQHLVKGLKSIGFKQSKVDECVFFRGNVIFIVYTDDGIFASPDKREVDKAIDEMKQHFDMEDQGDITDYLGVNVERQPNGDLKLTQPHLIQQVIDEVKLSRRIAGKQTPAASTKILRRDEHAPPFDQRFNYRRVVGKLNFLEKSTRPDISYATHQVARFCEDPKATHGEAIEHVAKYLRDTSNQGVILRPTPEKSFDVYADADFAGNWHKMTASEDPSTAKSRTGYVTLYAGCPVAWPSKLQTIIALSSCEAEYVSLSESLRDTIPLMDLVHEFKEHGFKVISTEPRVFCKAFEDNSGALEMARLPKLRPRTKHINIKYHHFREHVRLGLIKVFPISTDEQIAGAFTKPLAQNIFLKLRKALLHY